jgi:hypothetical protein
VPFTGRGGSSPPSDTRTLIRLLHRYRRSLAAGSALRARWFRGQDRRPCRGIHAGEPHHRQLLHLAAGVGRERRHRLADPAEPARARPAAHPRSVREMAARPRKRHPHLRRAYAVRRRHSPAVLRVVGQARSVLGKPLLRVRHELHPGPPDDHRWAEPDAAQPATRPGRPGLGHAATPRSGRRLWPDLEGLHRLVQLPGELLPATQRLAEHRLVRRHRHRCQERRFPSCRWCGTTAPTTSTLWPT